MCRHSTVQLGLAAAVGGDVTGLAVGDLGWHVDTKSVAIHSQLITCTASEVAAMIEGAMHHRTEMDVEANYVDSHGQSEIEFGLTRLLGFELKPRLKRINHTKLYIPDAEFRARIRELAPVLAGRGPISRGMRKAGEDPDQTRPAQERGTALGPLPRSRVVISGAHPRCGIPLPTAD